MLYPILHEDISPNECRARTRLPWITVQRAPGHTNMSYQECSEGWLGSTNDIDAHALGEFDEHAIGDLVECVESALGQTIDHAALAQWIDSDNDDPHTVILVGDSLANIIANATGVGIATYTAAGPEKIIERLLEDRPIDQAAVSYALDSAAYHGISTRGSHGISAVDAVLLDADDEPLAVIADAEAARSGVEWDETWDAPTFGEYDVLGEVAEGGELTRSDLDEITGSLWDGNNHVEFCPPRSQEFCDEEDIEEESWGTVTYMTETYGDEAVRTISHTACKPDWACLGWEDMSGYDTAGDALLTREQFDALEDLSIDGVEQFTDDPDEVNAYFCLKTDADRIIAEIKAELIDD